MNRRAKIIYWLCGIVVFSVLSVGLVRSKYVLPVLMYHHIMDSKMSDRLSVSPKTFEKQVRYLAENKYHIITLAEAVKMLNRPRRPRGKYAVITFDDGNADFYENAYPILKKYNVPATVFLIVDFIDKPGYLRWEQIYEMAEDNIVFGSHTLTHPWLPNLGEAEMKREIVGSKAILEKRLVRRVNFIAYPQGAFDRRVLDIVKKAGYSGGCATNPGKKFPSRDPFAMKRTRISENSRNLLIFWFESSGYYTWIKEIRKREKNP